MTELEKLKKYLDEHGVVNDYHDNMKPGKIDQIIVYREFNGEPDWNDAINEQPWTFLKVFDKWFIRSWDVVCHEYSYGGTAGLLEIYGDIAGLEPGDVDGWLTAENVIHKYMDHDPRYCWED